MEKRKLVVTALLAELLDETLDHYKKNLSNSGNSTGNDDPYARMRSVLIRLPVEEQEKIFGFLQLVIIDTVSTIFGTIDGSHFPLNIDGDFILEYEGEEIQGYLQDEVISKAEEMGIYK